ncbi:helix-turn-helix domain-containing protein [Amorphus sp. 3PC139-8]|uniref:helix-turn-helix domain-containing protein n=1 Tax=Amorphus sp. 3PC139-8 TaxID=2735676 RepID=UPI00345D0C1B
MQTNLFSLEDVAVGSAAVAGEERLIEIQPNFYLALTDIPIDEEQSRFGEPSAFAAISILLQGHVGTNVPGMEELRPDSMLLTSHNGVGEFSSHLYGATRLRNVEVFVTPDWFEGSVGTLSGDPAFEALHDSMNRPAFHSSRPLPTRFRELASNALTPIGTGGVAAMRLEAMALDLLATLAESAFEPEQIDPLPRRDRYRIRAVREAIETRPAEIASLAALSAEFGVSPSKLKRDFFLAFSTCVGGFINEQKLLHGHRLLEQGMSVSQTAYALGYAHPGNFSTAFKRHFGVSPREIRT